MKLRPEQLEQHLRQPLLPLYVVSGDVPLLVQEVVDSIRHAARQQGYGERNVYYAENGFDWQDLLQAGSGMSLFAERRLIELNLPSAKPGDAGSRVLQAYCRNLSRDNTLLVIAGKIDKATQNSKWFKTLDGAGAVIQLWPLERNQLPGWLERRMRARGLQPTRDALMMLVDRVEGNLLAAAQEIEKLLLLRGEGVIDVDAVTESVSDNARYDIFGLVDETLTGNFNRISRMIRSLRAEGVEPTLVLWSLARECRALAAMADELARGDRPANVFSRHQVWPKRQGSVKLALKRHHVAGWSRLIRRAAQIDRQIKGMAPGNVWDELLQLALDMAGISSKQMA